jgi:autophagy-related protein 9
VALANLLLAPFLLAFLLIYFFMRNAERFYHQPSAAGARRWSSLAAWRLREFNELPHYLHHRCGLQHVSSHRTAQMQIRALPQGQRPATIRW